MDKQEAINWISDRLCTLELIFAENDRYTDEQDDEQAALSVAFESLRAQPDNQPLTCEGCIDAREGKTCGTVACIRNPWLGLTDRYRPKED